MFTHTAQQPVDARGWLGDRWQALAHLLDRSAKYRMMRAHDAPADVFGIPPPTVAAVELLWQEAHLFKLTRNPSDVDVVCQAGLGNGLAAIVAESEPDAVEQRARLEIRGGNGRDSGCEQTP
jgi:hypothetical protein